MAGQNSTDFDVAKLKNLNRVTSFPIIRQTLDFSFAAYARVKKMNTLLEDTLTKVEQISTGVIGNFKPVVGRFDKQIIQADGVFGQVLDKLENYVPSVKTVSPTNMYEYTVNSAGQFRNVIFQQVQNVKEFGFSKAASVGQFPVVKAGFHALDAILHAIDGAVDAYLPAGDDTDSDSESDNEESSQNLNTLKKITNLTLKLRKRLTKFTVDKVHYVQRLYF